MKVIFSAASDIRKVRFLRKALPRSCLNRTEKEILSLLGQSVEDKSVIVFALTDFAKIKESRFPLSILDLEVMDRFKVSSLKLSAGSRASVNCF